MGFKGALFGNAKTACMYHRTDVCLAEKEHEFIERLNARGEISPELLTPNGTVRNLIREHPGLK